MTSKNSIMHDYDEIKKAGQFLIDQGFEIQEPEEFCLVFSSVSINIECVYERYYNHSRVEVIFKDDGHPRLLNGEAEPYPVLWYAYREKEYDDIIISTNIKSEVDRIKLAFKLLKLYPDRFLNPDYLIKLDKKHNSGYAVKTLDK